MPDVFALKAAFDGIKGAMDVVSIIRTSQKAFDQAELKLKIADLATALADAKLALLDVQELVAEKDAEIERLNSVI